MEFEPVISAGFEPRIQIGLNPFEPVILTEKAVITVRHAY